MMNVVSTAEKRPVYLRQYGSDSLQRSTYEDEQDIHAPIPPIGHGSISFMGYFRVNVPSASILGQFSSSFILWVRTISP